MIVTPVFDLFHETAARRDIHFASDDRMDALGGHGLIELDRSVHGAVVGNGTGSHAQFFQTGSQTLDADRTIQKTVFGMKVQVHKTLQRLFCHLFFLLFFPFEKRSCCFTGAFRN